MRKIIIGILSVLLALAAAAAVIWPAYEKLESARRVEDQAVRLIQLLETMDPALARKHRNLAMWYNLAVRSDTGVQEARRAYGGILDLGNRAMGVLEIPMQELSLPIYHGGGRAAEGIAHRPESALPVGGQGNHTVLEVRDTYGGGIFKKLEIGVVFRIWIPGGILAYQVDEIVSVPNDRIPELAAEDGEDLCTLVIHEEKESIYLRCSRTEGVPAARETGLRHPKSAFLLAFAAAAAAGMMPGILGMIAGRGKRMRRKTTAL